jgi:hypothetical protein
MLALSPTTGSRPRPARSWRLQPYIIAGIRHPAFGRYASYSKVIVAINMTQKR